ncbi:carboxymuconolactone decarboxylase family protein [Flavobacterium soyangense]|uniref:Carboxymuconolactone decarboxylase family protein n=1 Tax=Flavobacterium soyangense TaxID=2023265 RepID=A0A930UES6_9FLAO|nr:carboxymuconolactone decarboxylase family protein [Flavobacterium soyangense]MBF2709439.1 carboxymuconolactone decarboxylase family protein [Flavobacterium soyangense]
MARLRTIHPDNADGKTKRLFNTVQHKLGKVPNMLRIMGNSPAVLEGYLSFSAALNENSIGAELNELIALTVANENGSNYCHVAHFYQGEKIICLDIVTLEHAIHGESHDPKINTALKFALEVIASKGKVSDKMINEIKSAGYDDTQISEIVGTVALNIFTDYFNNVAQTDIDGPVLPIY